MTNPKICWMISVPKGQHVDLPKLQQHLTVAFTDSIPSHEEIEALPEQRQVVRQNVVISAFIKGTFLAAIPITCE